MTGRRAIETLTAAPAQAITLIARRLPPASIPDSKQVARWIAELGSDVFEQRHQATDALDRLGEAAGPALRNALAATPTLEARRRMEDLLRKLAPPVVQPEALRAIRAVQVLEGVGNAEAQRLLQALARGAAGVRITEEAAAGLRRLKPPAN